MSELYIGLMSGTSMDGIDAALVDFETKELTLMGCHEEKISLELKTQLLSLCQPGDNEINRMGELDVQFGHLLATATNNLLHKTNTPASAIKAIGSHGQTIRHQPTGKLHFTLQIGDPNVIATETGITTVADFRRRDMAEGGEGAPLAPAFHEYIFRTNKKNRIVLNIGGIANITTLPKNPDQPTSGFDTGPGNMLIDYWCNKHLNQAYDNDGQWAKSGKVDQQLLSNMLNDKYFSIKPPKSTGREYFNNKWLANRLDKLPYNIEPQNVQATLVVLTAQTIIDAIKAFSTSQAEIFVCGGGVHNLYLMDQLRILSASDYQLYSTTELGIDPDYVEAMLFAWLAHRTLNKQPGNLTAVTGAKNSVILGGLYQ